MSGKGKIDVISHNKKIKVKRGNMRNTLWKLYYNSKKEVDKDGFKSRKKNLFVQRAS